jgi:hypothetical protein
LIVFLKETLDSLDVTQSTTTTTPKEGRVVARALSHLLKQRPSIKTLVTVSLGINVIVPLLRLLSTNRSLLELDISSNALHDSGAEVVSLFLRQDSHLVALSCLGNGFGLPGMLALHSSVVQSKHEPSLLFLM